MVQELHLTEVVTPVWPLKGLRDRLMARGPKRLCTTVLYDQLVEVSDFSVSLIGTLSLLVFERW